MFCGFFLCLLGITFGILPLIDGAVRFTQVPPSILYVPSGGTAKFVWDYHVDDRNSEFDTMSPAWYYNNSSGKTLIAGDVKTYVSGRWEWIWSVSSSCPGRLRHRISKENVATLVISDLNTLDNGNYSCELVLNGGHNLRSETQLIVTVSPKFSINPPSSVVISESSNLGVPCEATGQPTPKITWVRLRDRAIISRGVGSATLSIPTIRRDQNGTYECQATNNPNESPLSARTNVEVQYAPSITTRPKDIVVTKGDQIVLTCRASGNPSPSISWSKESGTIRPGHTASGNTLVIPDSVKTDAGKYICKASNVYEMATHTAVASGYVTVKYQPTILSKSQNQIINETDLLRLTCKADGYPAPNITWTKSSGSITSSVGLIGNEYHIQSAKRSDTGTYTCTASNGIGREAMASIQVTVQYKAEIDVSKSTKALDSWNGKQIRLRCSFIGNPVARVTWYKPSGSKISKQDDRTNNNEGGTFSSELNITTNAPEDYGKYRCFVTNVVGSEEHYIMVKQLFTPFEPAQPHSISDSKGTQITIFWCVPDVKGGTPVIDYKVEINTDPPREFISKNTFAEVKDLQENTQYTVKIYARNRAGYGDPVHSVIVTQNPENHTTFIVASLVTILVISLVANALFIITLIKTQRAENKCKLTRRSRNTSYENKTNVELESIPDKETFCSNDANVSPGIQSDASCEAVVDNASHYQSLSSATRRTVDEARPPQLYEPLIADSKKPRQSEYASVQINSRSNPKGVVEEENPKEQTTVA